MKENNKKKVYMILGIIAFVIYILLYMVTTVTNMIFYHQGVLPGILNFLRVIIFNGFILFYLIYNQKKKTKGDKVIHIIFFVLTTIMIFLLSKDLVSEILFVFRYGGNKIALGLIVLQIFLEIITYILLDVILLGLMIQKKFPYSILIYLAMGAIAVAVFLGLIANIINAVTYMNVRFFIRSFLSLLMGILLGVFQVCYLLMIKEKTKEIK